MSPRQAVPGARYDVSGKQRAAVQAQVEANACAITTLAPRTSEPTIHERQGNSCGLSGEGTLSGPSENRDVFRRSDPWTGSKRPGQRPLSREPAPAMRSTVHESP